MPDVTTLAIVGAVCAALLVLAWALFVAVARSDGQDGPSPEHQPTRRPTVVADTGAIRDRLRDALPILRAQRLTLTVDIDGRPAVLASAPGVVEAHGGPGPRIAVPVHVGGELVARLEAVRAPGERFDAGDTLVLRKVADSVAKSMQTAVADAMDVERSSVYVVVDDRSAMA